LKKKVPFSNELFWRNFVKLKHTQTNKSNPRRCQKIIKYTTPKNQKKNLFEDPLELFQKPVPHSFILLRFSGGTEATFSSITFLTSEEKNSGPLTLRLFFCFTSKNWQQSTKKKDKYPFLNLILIKVLKCQNQASIFFKFVAI